MNIAEAATYLIVSEKTLRRWVKKGLLPKRRGGGAFCNAYDFQRADLDAAIRMADSFKHGQLGLGAPGSIDGRGAEGVAK